MSNLLNPLNLTAEQKKECFNKLFEESLPNISFFLMLTLSTIIVTLGLLINNTAIIIGGMLIAPLLFPISSFALGIVVSDYKLIRNSALVTLQAVLLITIISILIPFLMLDRGLTPEILARTENTQIYFIIAFVSGIASSYALSHPKMSEILPGVAIAVSLLPPLAVFGIGISFLNWEIIVRAISLFGINLLGIIFASLIVFSILRFNDIRSTIKSKINKEEKEANKEKIEKEKKDITKEVKKIKKTLQQASDIIENKK
ncbi:MAG: TIGR00341 family protein [bacterium]